MEYDKKELEELLILYALDELEPEEAAAVEEELRKRPELAVQVNKARSLDGLLSDVYAQSVEPVSQVITEESDKPKVASKTETSRRLARRFAFTAAALSLFFVVGALLYPQFVKNDVPVAMTSGETTENKSLSLDTVTEDVKRKESAPAAKESVLEKAQEEAQQVDMNALDVAEDVDVAEEAEEVAAEDIAPEVVGVEMNIAEDDMPAPAPATASVPALAPASALPMEDDASLDNAPVPLAAEPEQEEAHAQYYMKNALYDIPSQKTADGMAPIKGVTPPMKQELLPEESLGEMAVDQMNKRLEKQRKVQGEKSAFKKSRQKGIAYGDEAALVPGSYVVLQKSVMEGNRLPNPESVKVEQWLNYFGVAELVKVTEYKDEGVDKKDAQFAKAVNQFAAALSSPEPVDVKAFEEVLDLLKDSVGEDTKRLEFKAIVEKTIKIKKKSE
ncbi:MAG: hypothetical protein IJQ39_08650 [Thermoguttaceae bacterium]|nr:hypothetical protein [Thermoguttaceae bacterium]